MSQPLEQFCQAHESWLHDVIDALVSIESPTDDKAAVDRCGAEFRARASAAGLRVRVEARPDAGDHTVAEIGEGGPRILLVGHVDTVWPHGQIARMPLERRDGKLWGPGTLDMKVGVAMGLLATRAVFETLRPAAGRVAMLVTSDEETGSDTSRALIEAEALASDAVLVLEPALAGGPLKTSRKGIGQYHLAVTGVSAHAGVDPRKGVSAIRELARQILALEALHDLDRGVSVNVGVVSGGTRPNVVAEEAHAVVDVRAPSLDDAARVDAAFRALRPICRARGWRSPAASSGRRWSGRPAWPRSTPTRRRPPPRSGRRCRKAARAADRTATSRRRSACPRSTAWAPWATARTRSHEHVELAPLMPRTALLAALIARLLSPDGVLPAASSR